MSPSTRLFLSVILALTFAGSAQAHSVPTHKNITTATLGFLRAQAPEFSCSSSIFDAQLLTGTEHEDDSFESILWPLGRYFFHFFPNLNRDGNQTTCSSLEWGFGGLLQSGGGPPCTASNTPSAVIAPDRQNTHRWQDALRNARDSTGQPSAQGWLDIGYVLHLFQDLTSPAHTRNDPHPHLSVKDANLGDPDPVEVVNRNPALPTGGLISFADPATFFTELRDWTRSHFYSSDTVFDPSQPGPTSQSQDVNY